MRRIFRAILSAAIGAYSGAGDVNFAKGDGVINDTVGALQKGLHKKGMNPTVKRNAYKTYRKAIRHLGKSAGLDSLSNLAYGSIYEFTSQTTNQAISRIIGW